MMSVLFCTQVFAGGIVDPKTTAGSSSAVVKLVGSKIVKVYYKSEALGNVEISIVNSSGREVFSESIDKTDGFMRPYNFGSMPEGEYTVTVKDGYGKMVEKVSYTNLRIHKLIKVQKLTESDKYLLTIVSERKDDVTILISDSNDSLVYREAVTVDGEFGRVYNIKGLKNFSIDVIDSNGILKSIKY